MKQFVWFAISLILIACSKDDKKPSRNETLKPAFTKADCQGGPAVSDLIGNWHTSFRSENTEVIFHHSFAADGTLTLRSDCSNGVSAAVQAPYSATSNRLTILASRQKTETVGANSCDVSLSQGSLEYTFLGQCLVFTDGTEKLYLLPSF